MILQKILILTKRRLAHLMEWKGKKYLLYSDNIWKSDKQLGMSLLKPRKFYFTFVYIIFWSKQFYFSFSVIQKQKQKNTFFKHQCSPFDMFSIFLFLIFASVVFTLLSFLLHVEWHYVSFYNNLIYHYINLNCYLEVALNHVSYFNALCAYFSHLPHFSW